MKISKIKIHNFRSLIDAEFEAHPYLMFVGPNNSGKSNLLSALRAFYEDIKWSGDDFPIRGSEDNDSWVEITFNLNEDEWVNLKDDYKKDVENRELILRRYFKGAKCKKDQSNIFAIVNGIETEHNFYGAKNVSKAKCGSIIYIPALTTPNDQMKTSGPSPFRDMLNLLMKKIVTKSSVYGELESAFEKLNKEANQEDGFLSQIGTPINNALEGWNIDFNLSINPVKVEDISKNLVKHGFVDKSLGEDAFAIEKFGHGFQRAVIYELIRLAPTFKDEKKSDKKEFNPDFTLILFEEPEAFLHPSQQESMAYHLRRLGEDNTQQVFVTTHSPIFVGKTSDEICQIVRMQRDGGVSSIYQIPYDKKDELLLKGKEFKKRVENLSDELLGEIEIQEEKYHYQLWFDADRSSMFFADKVLLVEGATEKAFFNYLISQKWYELQKEKIYVVNALGKFNFHRYLALFEAFGIPHGLIYDADSNSKDRKQTIINELINEVKNKFTLAEPTVFEKDFEDYLGLEKPDRNDQKPLSALSAVDRNEVDEDKLENLKKDFCSALAIKSE